MLVEEGNIVDGKISVITNFGAFVELPEGKTGLLHISEVAEEYVKDIRAYLTENQSVKVKILSIDKKGKISLSMRKVSNKPTTEGDKEIIAEKQTKNVEDVSFEDRLAKFMKDSDEKLHYLKKNFESRRNSKKSGSNRKTSKY